MSVKRSVVAAECRPDVDLLADVQTIYREHNDWLLGWLGKKTECPELAQDLAQDTFVRVLKKAGRGERVGKPRVFLVQVARGLLIDHWRRREIEQACLQALAARPEALAISPEERQIILDTLLAIDAMLNTLPLKVRRAFLLSRLDGLSYKQIAAQLGVSERMVKKYMARAMLHCLTLKESLIESEIPCGTRMCRQNR